MTRRSFAIRHLKFAPPGEEAASKYLLHWETGDLYRAPESFPRISTAQLFGTEGPLELEIGCGTGEFLCTLAANNPSRYFVGIDISLKAIYIAVENAHSHGLNDIKFVKAAVQFIYPLLVPGSLDAIYIHFPDPCLHPKYRKRRIFNRDFLDIAFRALADRGLISVVTDKPVLFWDLLAIIEEDSRYEKTHAERYLTGFDPGVKSRYQSIWEKHGTEPLRFEVRKQAEVAANAPGDSIAGIK